MLNLFGEVLFGNQFLHPTAKDLHLLVNRWKSHIRLDASSASHSTISKTLATDSSLHDLVAN
jgi:hypothetical protein